MKCEHFPLSYHRRIVAGYLLSPVEGGTVNNNPDFIEVQKFLGGVDYPASKQELLRTAEESGAGDEALNALRGLPERDYQDPTEVSEAIAG